MMFARISFLKAYPLPFAALSGLIAGGLFGLVGRPDIGAPIWYATLLFGGAPVVYHTLRGVLKGRFAADIVAMLAIITAILTDEAFAGVIIVLMQTGGEALDDYGFRRATSSLDALIARAPKIAHRKRKEDGGIEEVEVKEVAVGDTIMVRPGDLVPVDGSLTRGPAEIDESAVTGEPLPRSKVEGDPLMSGSINTGQAFEMSATKVSTDSQYSKIVELVKEAQQEKPPIQRLADRYAIAFTPLTLLVAALGWLITHEVSTILAVLVVATPCPLILATPLAVISGVNRAAKESIIVKSGTAIEQIGKARVVIFDKTGTLTYGTPLVEKVVSMDGEEEVLLRKAASVEQLSSHPVAKALVESGTRSFGSLQLPSNFRETPGQGVEADLDSEHIVLGSQRFCESKLSRPFDGELGKVLGEVRHAGKMVSFMAIEGRPAGAVIFTDQMRAGVPAMLLRLRELGVEHTVMLTGDNKTNAEVIARQAGIEKVEANLLPAQKVDEVRKLTREYGTAMMVGDGINDAPALASATVGVAMGAHGTGISSEAADVVLLVDDITKVADGMAIGQRMLKVAKESIFFGLGASFVLMAVASLGYIEPAFGAIWQEVVDVTVILNALRARA